MEAYIIQGLIIVFFSGIAWNKIAALEKRVKGSEDIKERLVRIETKLEMIMSTFKHSDHVNN